MEIPIIIIVHTSMLISETDFLPKDEERFFSSPVTMHIINISTPRTRAALTS